MRDIYRELLERSLKDAIESIQEIEEDYGVQVTEPEVFAVALYQYRVQQQLLNQQNGNGLKFPEPTDYGRQ